MFNLSNQTNLFLIVIAITTIINLICITIVFKGFGFMVFTILALFSTPTYILYIYNVNCLTAGDCQIWSWYVTIISSISLIIVSVIMIYLTSISPIQDNATISLSSSITKPFEIKLNKPIITTATPPSVTPLPVTPQPVTPPYTGLTQEEYKKQFDQHTQKDLFISEQFKKTNLTREEKNELWRQQLELEYQGLLFAQKDIQTYLLRQNLTPEVRQLQHNMYVINKRFIKQRENPIYTNKSRIEYPPLLGNYYPHRIESIKLKIKLVMEQIQIIQNELLNSSLPNIQRTILQQQLRILQKMQDDLPPKPGNYLYDAYIASARPANSSNSGNTSNPSFNSSNSSNSSSSSSSTQAVEAPRRAMAEAIFIQGEEVPIINLPKSGEGYLTPPTVIFNGGVVPSGGTMASAVAVLGTGRNSDKVDRIVYTSYGSGYANYGNGYGSPPIISFTGGTAVPGNNIVPPIAIASKERPFIISSINITDPGAGYKSAPDVLIDGNIIPNYNGLGNGRVAKAKAILGTTTGFTDKVVNIILEDAGFNYSNNLNITLTPPPGNTSNPLANSSNSAIFTPSNEFYDIPEQTQQILEQQIQKTTYISEQFRRANLTREEKNELWRQQLELEYKGLLYGQKDIQTYLLRQDLTPDVRKFQQNMFVINKRFIKQRENMQIQYPPLIGNYYPHRIESFKLKLQLITQQIQYIEQELDKSDLPTLERDALMEQLTILQQIEYELPPKPGNYLYNAYIDPNHIDNTQSGGNTSTLSQPSTPLPSWMPSLQSVSSSPDSPITPPVMGNSLTHDYLYQQELYLNQEFNKSDLNLEKRRSLWQQQLQLIYQRTIFMLNSLRQEILLPNMRPEEKQNLQNLIIIMIKLIEQQDNMRMQNLLPQLEPHQLPQFEIFKFQILLLTQQKEFINQELLKQELQTNQRDTLQQQLKLISQMSGIIIFSMLIYISIEAKVFIDKSNLNQEELRKLIQFTVMSLKLILIFAEEYLLKPDISSEDRKEIQDWIVIYIILIQKFENMLIQNQLPQLEPNIKIEQLFENLTKQLLTQHKLFIQQELLKPELQASQRDKLQQQLTIINNYDTMIIKLKSKTNNS